MKSTLLMKLIEFVFFFSRRENLLDLILDVGEKKTIDRIEYTKKRQIERPSIFFFSGWKTMRRVEFSHFVLFGAPLVLPPHLLHLVVTKMKWNQKRSGGRERERETSTIIYHHTKSIPNEAQTQRMLRLYVLRLINKQFEFIVHIA